MMQLFYTNNVSEGTATFSREESGHCLRVLRMRRGDTVHFTDGQAICMKASSLKTTPLI